MEDRFRSFISQWLDADAPYQEILEQLKAEDLSDDEREKLLALKKAYGEAKAGAAIGGGLAALNGATQLLNIAQQNAQIGDTTQQQNMIQDIGAIGSDGYSSYDQVINDYNRLNTLQPDLSYDTIRGGSTKERVGNVLSGTVAGITSGAQVGGIYGAIAGGVIGLGSGIGGWLVGDRNAEVEQDRLALNQRIASETANTNLEARNEELSDWNARKAFVNSVAKGGQIERKQSTMKEFADRVLKRTLPSAENNPAGIVRKHCKGGTMVRIQR